MKWEYLQVYNRSNIRCNQRKINDITDTLKRAFPNSKLKVKDEFIETNIWDMELIDFLGSQGWELVAATDQAPPGLTR